LLAAAKKRLGKKRPYLLWKFVVFSHNSHEIAVARSSAKIWVLMESSSTLIIETKKSRRVSRPTFEPRADQ
jgi:hypothetical protein